MVPTMDTFINILIKKLPNPLQKAKVLLCISKLNRKLHMQQQEATGN